MLIIRRSDCFPLLIVVCTVLAVGIVESRLATCVHCVENVSYQATFSTQCRYEEPIANSGSKSEKKVKALPSARYG